MDKATFIKTLSEERCNDFRLRLAMEIEDTLKVIRIALILVHKSGFPLPTPPIACQNKCGEA